MQRLIPFETIARRRRSNRRGSQFPNGGERGRQVIPERDRRVRAGEHRAGVGHPGRQLGRVPGLDLQVLGRPGVADGERGVFVVDQHAGGLAVEGFLYPLAVPGGGYLPGELLIDAVGQGGVGGDEQARGELVVLGLGDQVGGDVPGVGGVVGDDRHLRRAGFAIGADHAAEHALGRGHVDVARAGDDVGRRAVLRAVGEHGQRLRAAGRVHLGHAEQRARGQHGRVRQAAVADLRRRRYRDRGHARGLGRDDVHHDGGGVGHQAAGDVHPGPPDRDEAAGDGETAGDPGDDLGRDLRAVHAPGPAGGLLQGGPDVRVEPGQGRLQGLPRHPGGGQVRAVETGRVLADRVGAAAPDVVADRADAGDGRLDVGRGPGQDAF